MTAEPAWLIYGANGYTGSLIAREAAGRGLRPVLAGRRKEAVQKLANELGCPARVLELRSGQQVAKQLAEVAVVLNCAGPFSQTARTMIEACFLVGAHYLDITGEIDVIEWAAAQGDRAKAAGVCLIPAVGFDVVPSDCLAALLAQRLPSATRLELAFWSSDSLSPGTARTVWQRAGEGGSVRRGGRMTRVPQAWKVVTIPFHDRPRQAVTVPWGDVATAYYTTGIPNIEVYAAVPPLVIHTLRPFRSLAWLTRVPPLPSIAHWLIGHFVPGPGEERRRKSRAQFWGRATDAMDRHVEATLQTRGGYALTTQTAIAAVQKVLSGTVPAGFSTPAKAFGAEFVLNLPGVVLHDKVTR
jgi:short subunit dehydrogenase-like uncharacterized protein